MAAPLASMVFVALVLVFGTLSWSRWLTTQRQRRRIIRRVGRRPARARVFQESADAEELALRGRLPALRRLLVRAGSRLSISQLLLFTLGFAGIGVFLMTAVAPGPASLLGLAPGALPWLRLRSELRTRRDRLNELLPKAIETLVSTLRAGQSLPDGLRVAGLSTAAPLGPELAKVAEECSYGVPLRAALDELQDRLPHSFELRMVTGAMLLNQETGGNLIESLTHVVEALRERRIFAEKLSASTTEARLSATVLAALPAISSVVLLLIAPDYLSHLWAPGLLRTAFLACLGWMAVGLVVMTRLTSPEGRWQA